MRSASLALLLALGCVPGRPHVVTVADLLHDSGALGGQRVVVAGRAEDVRYQKPEGALSGVSFRLVDGTGAIAVFHEGTLDLRSGTLVQVRGHLGRAPDGGTRLIADRIWILPGAVAPR